AAAGQPHGPRGAGVDRRQRSDEVLAVRHPPVYRCQGCARDGRTRLARRESHGDRSDHQGLLRLLPPGHGAVMEAATDFRRMSTRDLRLELEEIYAEYAACLDECELGKWPELFTDQCVYKIIPRENYSRGLPLAIWLSESKGML